MKLSKEGSLLRDIFEHYGGYSEVARRYNVSRQLVFQWIRRGAVTKRRVKAMAKDLNVPIAALNYKSFCQLNPNPPPFDSILKQVHKVLN